MAVERRAVLFWVKRVRGGLSSLLKKRTRILNHVSEVLLVRQQLLVVDDRLIENRAREFRGLLRAERAEDRVVDVVTDEVVALFALEEVERLRIDGRQSQLFGRVLHLLAHVGLLLLHLAHLVVASGLLLLLVATASAVMALVVVAASVVISCRFLLEIL